MAENFSRDKHTHVGDETESYDKIVGSLGEVEDEGCVDLNGIRLISHDEAYESVAEKQNYEEIVKAMVLGEALANPAFKKRR